MLWAGSGPAADARSVPINERFAAILDLDDLGDLSAQGIRPRDLSLLAMDPDVHLALTPDMPHLTPWDLVDRDDWPQIQAWTESVWRFWQTHAHVEFRGFDLLRIASYRHYECLTKLAWASFVLRRAFERLRPAEIVTFIESSGHGLSQPPAYRKYPPLFALLRGLAEQAGVSLKLVRRRGEPFVDLAASPGLHDGASPGSGRVELPDRPYVLFYGNGVDLRQQIPLIRELRRADLLEVVQVYKVADAETLAAARAVGHAVLHESRLAAAAGGASEADPAALAAEAERGRARLARAARQADASLRAIFDNAHLEIHFGFVFGEYVRRIARHVTTWSGLFHARPPTAVVAHDQAPLPAVARACGVPCLSLSHGLILGDTRWYGGLTPVVGAVSEAHRGQLLGAGLRPEDVAVTGSLWLDRFVDGDAPNANADDRRGKSRAAVNEVLALPRDRRLVLVCTSTVGTFSKSSNLPHAHWREALDDLRNLVRLAARNRDWAMVLKAHPRYDHGAFYERLARQLPVGAICRVTGTAPLEQLAFAADAIVLPNVLSSSLVEVSFAGCPVLVLDRCLLAYDAAEHLTRRWPHVHSVAELEASLARMFRDPAVWAEAASQTRAGLRGMLGDSPVPAAPRCAAWLHEAAQSRPSRARSVQRRPVHAR